MSTYGVSDIGVNQMTVRQLRIVPSERTAQDISIVEVLYEEFGITSKEEMGKLTLDHGFKMPGTKALEDAKERYLKKVKDSRYKEKRYASYPSLADQLDMLYHDLKKGNFAQGKWVTAIDEVKNLYPKPEL